MTSLLDKPRTRGAGAGFVAGQPQVNLLPPEIRAARGREDRAFAERVGSAENMEAITAFFEKRPPDFSKL